MDIKKNTQKIILYLFFLYLFLFVVGILLSFWFGFGWFFLIITIGILLASSPRIYLPLVGLLMGNEFQNQLKKKIITNNNQRLISERTLLLIIFSILITIFAFWKINIPLRTIISAIISP